jgi:hypothetical protein
MTAVSDVGPQTVSRAAVGELKLTTVRGQTAGLAARDVRPTKPTSPKPASIASNGSPTSTPTPVPSVTPGRHHGSRIGITADAAILLAVGTRKDLTDNVNSMANNLSS